MKILPSVTLTIVSLAINSLAQQTQPSSPWAAEYTPTEKGPHYTRWSRLSLTTNAQGSVSLHTNTFVQLRTGLNRWTGTEWAEAWPELIVTNNGILGHGAQHSAFFSSDLAGSRAPVRIWSPNGQTLAFRILGLAYHDVATGTNILLAAPKSSATQIIGTNSVWYVDALDDIKCDIRYLYSADGVRQHVVIRECPEPPAAYGLSNATTHLLVISELIDGPALQISQRSWAAGRETDNDQTLDFSSMRMVPGRAFSLRDPEPGRGTRVTKQYETVGDRRLIVERVRYSQVRDDLMRLPPAGMLMTNAPGVVVTNAAIQKRARWFAQGTLPPVGKSAVVAAARNQPTLPLAALSQKPGFVVDWELVDTVDWTFDSCYTYVISGECHLASARFQSAVIKYDMGSSLYVDGPLFWMDYGSCNSGSAAQLTSVNDDQIGEQIPWSTHQPAWGDYGPALVVQPQDLSTALQHMGCLYGCAYGEQCIIAGDPVLPIVSITASDSLATKGTSDSGAYTITRQYGDWRQPLPVQVSVGGTAVPNQDYVQITSPITIPANQQRVTVNVTPLAPSGVRYESTVVLTLEPQPGYVVGAPSSATVFVDDPSAAPVNIVLAPSGLMDWWRGENDFTDSAGSMPGTPANGLGFAAGEVGQGFNFDGVDDRLCTAAVTPPGPLDFGANADFSIEAWIKPIQASTTYGVQTILDKRVAPPGDYMAVGYAMWLIDGKLGCELSQNPMTAWNASNYGPAGPDLRDGRFHHVAMTVVRNSASGLKLYVDGAVVLTFNPTSEAGDLSNDGPLRIGNHANTYINCFFKGIIDEVSLYNRALTQSEVQSIFNSGRGGKSLDTDHDGLPDRWELLYFGSLNQTADADPDGDGLTNLEEWILGTNPTANDLPTGGSGAVHVHTPLQ